MLYNEWLGYGDHGNNSKVPMSSRLIRQNVPASWRIYKKSVSSQSSIGISRSPDSRFENTNAQCVTRWPPFYLTVKKEPKEALFFFSDVWDQSQFAIGSRRAIHCTSLCCSRMVNWVGIEQFDIKVTPQTTTATEFHVVSFPHTDSSSSLMGTHCCIALQGYLCASFPH